MTFEEAVAGTRERLIRSVELRLRADVPLAFCMSGGVDSNALITIARSVLRLRRARLHDRRTPTRATRSGTWSSTRCASSASATPRFPSTPTDFLPRLRELVRQHDAPVYTITYYAHWLLMEAIARAGYRISVSGTAADELFSGYYDHHLAYLQRGARATRRCTRPRARLAASTCSPIVRNPYLRDPDLFVDDPDFRDHIYLDADEFAATLTQPWQRAASPRRATRDEPAAQPHAQRAVLTRRCRSSCTRTTSTPCTSRSRTARRFSIASCSSSRCTIPTRHLVRDGRAKAVLRDAMRGIVPDAILDNRRKVGFNAPLDDLLDSNDPAVRAELLADRPIFDLVRRDAIAPLLEQRDLPNTQSKFLFYFVCAKLFLEEVCT